MPISASGHRSAQLSATGVSFAFGPRRVLDDVTVTLAPGDRLGIVGPNGTGKTTLLRLLAGELTPTAGSIRAAPADASVGLLHQVVDHSSAETVQAFLERRSGVTQITAAFEAAITALSAGEPGADDAYDRALQRYLDADAAGFPSKVDAALASVGLDPALADRPCAALSGGQRSRVGLAAIAVSSFDVLLLDEPTNDLDLDGLAMLERALVASSAPMAIVSHDRAFLAAVSTSILELTAHDHHATRFNGGYDAWVDERQRAADLHQRSYDDYQSKRAALTARAQRQREWSDRGVSRVRSSDENDKFIRRFRVSTSEQLAGKAKQTQQALDRLERNESVEAPWKPWELRLRFGEADRAGAEVTALHGAIVERGAFVLGPIDAIVGTTDRVLLTGPNGAGKTTLIDALLGRLDLSAGTRRVGPAAQPGLLAQDRELFGDAPSLIRAFVELAGCDDTEARSQLAKLGLATDRLDRPTATLSMGERTRAACGLFAMVGTNLLIVDEPTNHLDLPAIEALEAALDHYPHALIVVSHDRRFIESINATRRWHLEPSERHGKTRSVLVED